jgi:hypothetical protein
MRENTMRKKDIKFQSRSFVPEKKKQRVFSATMTMKIQRGVTIVSVDLVEKRVLPFNVLSHNRVINECKKLHSIDRYVEKK